MQSNCAEIGVRLDERVLEITIQRPERKNALTLAMYTTMADLLNEAAEDKAVRAVIITGTDTTFTAGNDLADFLNGGATSEESPVIQFLYALYNFPKPVIAAVEGVAVGIGTTMLLHCDMAYAGADAMFQMPFVNLGLVPEYASSFFLPRMLGHVKATELLLLGKKFGAEEAEKLGICNAAVPAGEALAAARKTAQQIATLAPEAIRLSKELLREGTKARGMEVIRNEAGHFHTRLQSEEFREAATAFMEKRPADFSRF